MIIATTTKMPIIQNAKALTAESVMTVHRVALYMLYRLLLPSPDVD